MRRHEGMSDGPLLRKKCKRRKCKDHGRLGTQHLFLMIKGMIRQALGPNVMLYCSKVSVIHIPDKTADKILNN